MNFLISNAMASINTLDTSANQISLFFMLLIVGLIFYFIIFLPQKKRTKEHKILIHSIEKGDEILTHGGLVGRVVQVNNDDYVTILLNTSTEVIIKRDFITTLLPKGTIKIF